MPGFEADDVIATLVATAPPNARISIASTDKDLMQLVSDRVTLLDGMKDRRYDPAGVEARFGVPPEHILDVRALVGDTSDNIPGVKGIGEKGAAQLITEWGSLENLLEHADEVEFESGSNFHRFDYHGGVPELVTVRRHVVTQHCVTVREERAGERAIKTGEVRGSKHAAATPAGHAWAVPALAGDGHRRQRCLFFRRRRARV